MELVAQHITLTRGQTGAGDAFVELRVAHIVGAAQHDAGERGGTVRVRVWIAVVIECFHPHLCVFIVANDEHGAHDGRACRNREDFNQFVGRRRRTERWQRRFLPKRRAAEIPDSAGFRLCCDFDAVFTFEVFAIGDDKYERALQTTQRLGGGWRIQADPVLDDSPIDVRVTAAIERLKWIALQCRFISTIQSLGGVLAVYGRPRLRHFRGRFGQQDAFGFVRLGVRGSLSRLLRQFLLGRRKWQRILDGANIAAHVTVICPRDEEVRLVQFRADYG